MLDVYAPVVHGIGVRDHKEFAEDSVRRVARHLERASWRRDSCPTTCDGFAIGHVHLVDDGDRSLVVDPITWFDEIRTPSRWRAAWWFLRALFVLCAVHLLVNGQVLLSAPSVAGLPRYVWRALRAMTWILLLGALTIALAVPLTLAVALVPRARILATDALGWTSDPETREKVIARVTSRVVATRARHTVLIGHSQGGAIATNACHVLEPATTTLVTMGNGQALLIPLRASRGIPWTSFAALVGAMIAYVAAALVIMRTLLLGAIELTAAVVRGLALLVRAATDPGAAPDHVAAAGAGIFAAVEALALSPQLFLVLIAIPVVAVTVLVYARLLAPIVRDIRHLLDPAIPGIDLCARFDGVSHPFAMLGPPRRVATITQSASLLDHMLYFDNRAEVLTEIERWITGAGGERTPDPRASVARRRMRHLVRSLRAARAVVALAAMAIASLLVPSALAAATIGSAAYAVMTLVKHLAWRAVQRDG